MSIGLSQEELATVIRATEAEVVEELKLVADGKTTVSASEQSMALYILLSVKTVDAIVANNQRIAEQLAGAGVVI